MNFLSILLIDDDAIERIKFKKVSNEIKFQGSITEANNAQSALAILEENNNAFDLIVTDINMPNMSGIEFLKKLKNHKKLKKIPVVIISTSNEIKDLKKSFKYGVSGYFIKPRFYSEYKKKVISLLHYWQNSEVIC